MPAKADEPMMTDPTNAELLAAVKAGLEHWNALPEDERNGERPWIMGWNSGYEFAQEQFAALGLDHPPTGETL